LNLATSEGGSISPPASTAQPARLLELILDIASRGESTTSMDARGNAMFGKDRQLTSTYREVLATRPDDRVFGKLRNYKQLSANWNGYGGNRPTDDAVEQCIDFLRSLGDISLPTPMVSGSGEVGLFWERAGTTIELGFKGDREYGYLVELPDGRWKEEEHVPIHEIRPLLQEALVAIAQT
jgi:hypothetical protein